MALVESVLSHIEKGDTTKASAELKELEVYAGDLANHAEHLATKATKQGEECQRQAENIQREVASLHEQVNYLRRSVQNKKSSVQFKQSQISDARNEHSRAERRLDNAQRELRDARDNQKIRRSVMPIVGAFIGNLLLPGAGFLLGAGAGLGGAEIINGLSDAEDDALYDVRKSKDQINRYEMEINSLQRDIQKLESDIQTLPQQILIKETERQIKSSEAERLKKEAVFFRRAAVFWKEFQHICENGGDRTALFRRILDKARAIETFDLHESSGMKRVAMSFIDAWEAMVVKYSDKEGQRYISREEL